MTNIFYLRKERENISTKRTKRSASAANNFSESENEDGVGRTHQNIKPVRSKRPTPQRKKSRVIKIYINFTYEQIKKNYDTFLCLE